jgi:hypothetical protein
MPEHLEPLTELLYMAFVYRKRHYDSLAIKLLTQLIRFEETSIRPDRARLALGLYNLAEIISDQGNYDGSHSLFDRAAELWHDACMSAPLNVLWYIEALQGLQAETDRLTKLAENREQQSNVA